MASFDFHATHTWLRIFVACVWFLFGLLFKALDAVPRHRQIVVRVVGETYGGAVLWLVAVLEIGLGAWMLIGRALPLCMGVQTLLIVVMNTLELRYARDLLLSPWGMISLNILFLALGWYVAVSAV